jgi:hypothetical protein
MLMKEEESVLMGGRQDKELKSNSRQMAVAASGCLGIDSCDRSLAFWTTLVVAGDYVICEIRDESRDVSDSRILPSFVECRYSQQSDAKPGSTSSSRIPTPTFLHVVPCFPHTRCF